LKDGLICKGIILQSLVTTRLYALLTPIKKENDSLKTPPCPCFAIYIKVKLGPVAKFVQ
jgi:hypothetical protein